MSQNLGFNLEHQDIVKIFAEFLFVLKFKIYLSANQNDRQGKITVIIILQFSPVPAYVVAGGNHPYAKFFRRAYTIHKSYFEFCR